MKKNGEWGEFFPIKFSLFGYNETVANEYYPISKVEAQKLGAKWQESDFSLQYDGPFYEPKDISQYSNNQAEIDALLSGILKCEVSGKPFKITPYELAFYMKCEVQIPRKHFNVRYLERFDLRNPRKLYHRQCMCEENDHGHEGRCPVEFETTYSPERSEKIYCEKCYQKSVI
jgi:hypothetical protein